MDAEDEAEEDGGERERRGSAGVRDERLASLDVMGASALEG